MLMNYAIISFITGVFKTANTDSVKNSILDTTGRSDIEKDFISSIKTVTATPPDQLVVSLGEKILHFGLKLLAAIVIYLMGAWLVKLARRALGGFFTKKKAEPAVVSFVTSLVIAVMWLIIIIIAVGTLGVETTSLAALLAAGGMAIGMALSGTVQNFAGGFMILVFKPFKVGDYIEAQGFAGTVSEVNITTTKLVTLDNRVIVLPNGALQSGSVNNYSEKEFRRVDLTIGVEYGSDSDKVKQLLLEIADSDERILTTAQGAPADPFVAVNALSPSSVDFIIKLWCKSENYWGVYYDTNERIYKTLPANGIEFPFQQVSVHLEGMGDNKPI